MAPTVSADSCSAQRRSARRHGVRVPVCILAVDERKLGSVGETRNVSSSGINFFLPQRLSPGSTIEYAFGLPARRPLIQIQCVGKVLRCEHMAGEPADRAYSIAVKMEDHHCVMPVAWEPGRGASITIASMSLGTALAVECWWGLCSRTRQMWQRLTAA